MEVQTCHLEVELGVSGRDFCALIVLGDEAEGSLVNFVKDIAVCIYNVLSGLQKHFGNSPC
jgi:hypothetical protein